MGGKRVGGEPGSDRALNEGRLPAATVEFERRMRVLGHRLDGNPSDLEERLSSHDGRGAAEHRGVPGVVPLLDEVVKERILDRERPVEVHVLFEGIGRIEVVRRLHERNHRVLHEPAHGRNEEVLRRHVVAVEDDDVLA